MSDGDHSGYYDIWLRQWSEDDLTRTALMHRLRIQKATEDADRSTKMLLYIARERERREAEEAAAKAASPEPPT